MDKKFKIIPPFMILVFFGLGIVFFLFPTQETQSAPDPNFGYETIGTAGYQPIGLDNQISHIVGSMFTVTQNGTADSITAYLHDATDGSQVRYAIYKASDNTLVAQTDTGYIDHYYEEYHWYTLNFSSPKPTLVANTDYILVAWADEVQAIVELAYNIGSANQGHEQDYNWPPGDPASFPPTASFTHDTNQYSIYCTYTAAVAPAWLEGWQYRRLVTINNTGSALSDYQVLVTLDTASLISAGKMRSDCGDIRLTDSDEITLLNYWVESGCNSASTKIWVKVPSISAGSKTIYVYYGNASVTSASNGANTFVFFDDFSEDLSKWTSLRGNWTTGGTLQGGFGTWPLYIRSNSQFDNAVLEVKELVSSPYRNCSVLFRLTDMNNHYQYRDSGANPGYAKLYKNVAGAGTELGSFSITDPPFDTWWKSTLKFAGNIKQFYMNDTYLGQEIVDTQFSSGYIGFTVNQIYQHFDDVRVRKYASPEPTTSVGGEETPGPPNQPPSATSVTDSPDPVSIGSGVTFVGNWTEPDSGDSVKMYICKDSSCTNCNNTSQTNCWCYSSAWNTEPDTTDTCTYTAQSGDVGDKGYWLGVCDDSSSCDSTPLSGGTFTVEAPPPPPQANVSGWAWSENIGWISFNCNNPELPAPRCTYNYGVNINPSTGIFSGYAWSRGTDTDVGGVGWISFNESELTGCPTAPCQAKLDLGTKQVSGWARALTDGGGWDGWIRLRGTNYGVSWNSSTKELEGWAWSDQVIEWISFNRVNCDPDKDGFSNGIGACPSAGTPISNYKVVYGVANTPPIAAISCHPNGCSEPAGSCSGYTLSNFCLKNDSTDPDGSADITKSEWDILNWGADPDLSCTSPNALCNYTLPSIAAGNYTVELYVEDLAEASDTETKPFTILQDAISDFKCSLDNSIWKACEAIRPSLGERVYFLDQSSPSDGATILHRSWTFPNGIPASDTDNNTNPSSRFQSAGQKQVVLNVTDSAGRNDSEIHFITILLPLPEWEEIPPF